MCPLVLPLLAELTRVGTPAMRSRGPHALSRPASARQRLAEPQVA